MSEDNIVYIDPSSQEALDLFLEQELADEPAPSPLREDPSEIVKPGPVQIATGESYPTKSGYAPGSYPEAQALGLQFDKPAKQKV